ncbi:MAG: hypothetical protein GVY28_04945 [Alphaproteobacteria bacterium]|jgi:hypothetical protein|nr:hypothetical protein [Alphaproteobacteria bacterium]
MPRYFDFEVSLRHIKPRIWRRLYLAADETTFLDLHHAIQDAGDWMDVHLWQFRTSGRPSQPIAEAPAEEAMGMDLIDDPGPPAHEVPLADVFGSAGDKCLYIYDFGDEWVHEVLLREVLELDEMFYRRLTDGARAFPPEDCGGPPGYELCRALVQPESESAMDLSPWGARDLEAQREWLGDWEPQVFDLQATKQWFDGESRRQLADKQQAMLDEIDDAFDEIDDEAR